MIPGSKLSTSLALYSRTQRSHHNSFDLCPSGGNAWSMNPTAHQILSALSSGFFQLLMMSQTLGCHDHVLGISACIQLSWKMKFIFDLWYHSFGLVQHLVNTCLIIYYDYLWSSSEIISVFPGIALRKSLNVITPLSSKFSFRMICCERKNNAEIYRWKLHL